MAVSVLRGTLVHCRRSKLEAVQVLDDHVIGFSSSDGKIRFVEQCCGGDHFRELGEKYDFDPNDVHTLTSSQFLMPGLVDTHIHAPQYCFTGTGYDRQLMEWLNTYTFPIESKFENLQFAKHVYPKVVRRTLSHGTTTASYFATIHLESSIELCRVVEQFGQRALVGKVNMDCCSPEFYCESTHASLQSTIDFVDHVQHMRNPLIEPVITPRFIPSCSPELMQGLADIASSKGGLKIQSHICEQKEEMNLVKKLHPHSCNSTNVFEQNGLLTDKTYMAHCIYLEEGELDRFLDRGVGVCHCPCSNFCIRSGVLDARRIIDKGIKIGLGTDISGGYSPSIIEAMRQAIHASNVLSFKKESDSEKYHTISYHEAFYMATLGGAEVLSLGEVVGNFEVGKQFDALLIDTAAPASYPVFDTFEMDSTDDLIMKFLYLGDDRNIVRVYVAGKIVSTN